MLLFFMQKYFTFFHSMRLLCTAICNSINYMSCGAVPSKRRKKMTKQEFKAVMSAFRKAKRAALFTATDSAWRALINSSDLAKKCKKPEFQPEVSRRVCNYLYQKGGLDAVRHIDSVEIRYN